MGAPLAQAGVRLAAAAVGAVRLGIPLDCVVQAIPVPAEQALLPRRQGALCGIVLHEGALVPVVDLARWVEVGTAPERPRGGARILVLHEAGRTLGLQVDSVDGLVEVPCSAIARLHHDEHPDEVFHSAAHVGESGQVLSLLDVGRLATLAASWHQAAPQAASPVTPLAAAAAGPDYALLQLDGVRLGVPAANLAEVMVMPALAQYGSGVAGAWCLWRGRQLPVLAPGALPGLPQAGNAPLLAVLEHEGLALGLPARAALALQAFAFEGSDLTATVYDADGKEVRLLDTAALFARCPEALLSKPATAAATIAAIQDGGVANEEACIVFEAGGPAATPIGAVEQILPLPRGMGATMPWNGATLPLVDLRPPALAGAPGHVLVASDGGSRAGYVVTRVALLVPAGSGRRYRLGAVEFITIDTPEGRASYRLVALAQAAISA